MTSSLSKRELAMIDLLRDALWEIETELQANDEREIKGNPLLQHKQQFVVRAKRKIATWEQDR